MENEFNNSASCDISIINTDFDESETVQDAEPVLNTAVIEHSNSINQHVKFFLDWSWIRRVLSIQRSEASAQYQLACLSTVGGGYFLCKKHEIALKISFGLLQLGQSMNNRAIVVRALIYLAINYKLLGFPNRSRRIFNEAYKLSMDNEHLTMICKSSELVSITEGIYILFLLTALYCHETLINVLVFSL